MLDAQCLMTNAAGVTPEADSPSPHKRQKLTCPQHVLKFKHSSLCRRATPMQRLPSRRRTSPHAATAPIAGVGAGSLPGPRAESELEEGVVLPIRGRFLRYQNVPGMQVLEVA